MKQDQSGQIQEYGDQLELDFKSILSEALVDPLKATLGELWDQVEPLFAQLPDTEQLRLAGAAIAQLAELHHLRAEQLLAEWEESHNEEGPVVSDDLLAGLVQQTMYLDISDLVRKSRSTRSRQSSKQHPPNDSVVGVVKKETMLAFVDAQVQDDEKHRALEVAHDEDVSKWIEAIATYLSSHPQRVRFSHLCQALNHHHPELTVIKIWLALLLGDYLLEQRGSFYDAESIWISTSTPS